jgi:hypothetical protein
MLLIMNECNVIPNQTTFLFLRSKVVRLGRGRYKQHTTYKQHDFYYTNLRARKWALGI